MQNKIFKISLILATGILLVMCNNKPISTQTGNTKKVVSLAPYFTQMIYLLGAQDQLAGCTSYCITNPHDSIPVVASVVDVNIEKLAILKPDVVLSLTLINPKTVETLTNLNIKVDTFGKVSSINTIYEQFLKIGKIVDKQQLAQEIVNREKARVDSIVKSIPDKKDSLKIFFQIGTDPVFTVIPNTFMNDYIRLAKCKNIAQGFEHGTITREAVVLSNPDIIFITTMGMAADKEKKSWENFSNINAVKNKKIFIVDEYKSCSPGPVSFSYMLEEMVHLIYK